MKLTEIQTIRFSKEDVLLMGRLTSLRINPDEFIRRSFREKIQRDLPTIIKEEEYRNSKEYCPF